MPTVSVIMPTFNRAGLLTEAIESVRAQTFQDWELLLVDDGSIDHTPQAVEAHRARDSRIRAIRQPNQGLSAARNAGLRPVVLAGMIHASWLSWPSLARV